MVFQTPFYVSRMQRALPHEFDKLPPLYDGNYLLKNGIE